MGSLDCSHSCVKDDSAPQQNTARVRGCFELDKEVMLQMHAEFESIAQRDEDSGLEYWTARALQAALGYKDWDRFKGAIQRAMVSCETTGGEPTEHFQPIDLIEELGSGVERRQDDMALTRYACYLIAQNADARKKAVAFAQAYFVVQTRRFEEVARYLDSLERLDARDRLKQSEKVLGGLIHDRTDGSSTTISRIKSCGDKALFGLSTRGMKARLEIPENRTLADFLHTIAIKAKDLANEMTNFKVERDDLRSNESIEGEHVRNNRAVRKSLTDQGIKPEDLPRGEDVRKTQRHVSKIDRDVQRLGKGKARGA